MSGKPETPLRKSGPQSKGQMKIQDVTPENDADQGQQEAPAETLHTARSAFSQTSTLRNMEEEEDVISPSPRKRTNSGTRKPRRRAIQEPIEEEQSVPLTLSQLEKRSTKLSSRPPSSSSMRKVKRPPEIFLNKLQSNLPTYVNDESWQPKQMITIIVEFLELDGTMLDNSQIGNVFVSYEFLRYPADQLETPAVPKNQSGTFTFQFKKSMKSWFFFN